MRVGRDRPRPFRLDRVVELHLAIAPLRIPVDGLLRRLDVGVDVFPGQNPNDTVLWIESHRAVVAGDSLVDFGDGLEINERWLQLQQVTREQVVEGLRPLLGLPVERVLAMHGGPFERSALERALSFS